MTFLASSLTHAILRVPERLLLLGMAPEGKGTLVFTHLSPLHRKNKR